MKSNALIAALSVVLISACSSVRLINTYQELLKQFDEYPPERLKIVTVDSSIYTVTAVAINDTAINVRGSKEKFGPPEKFRGTLQFNKIVLIETENFDFWKTLLFTGATAAVTYYGIPLLFNSTGLGGNVNIIHRSAGGGESCPFIYAWDGEKYKLQGEAFGVALGRKMEYETCTLLPDLQPENGFANVKLSNERPESHFFNRIKLVSAQADLNAKVFVDVNNRLWQCRDLTMPAEALCNNKNILKELSRDDDVYWRSDLSSANYENNFEDKVFVTFPYFVREDTASLIVSAINTDISWVVFKKLQSILGTDYINFLISTENDPEIINILKNILYRSSLKIDLWVNNNWKEIGKILPEANRVKFKKLLRIPVPVNCTDSLRIRLRCQTDVWRLDAVLMDETGAHMLKTKKCELVNAIKNQVSVIPEIKKIDENYTNILTGESVSLKFKAPGSRRAKKNVFALFAEGFLYELILSSEPLSANRLVILSDSSGKINALKTLLNNINLILPSIYAEWKLAGRKPAIGSDNY